MVTAQPGLPGARCRGVFSFLAVEVSAAFRGLPRIGFIRGRFFARIDLPTLPFEIGFEKFAGKDGKASKDPLA